MVSGSSDHTICVWDLDLGPIVECDTDIDGCLDVNNYGERQVTAEVRAVLEGHSEGVVDLRVDKEWIVSSYVPFSFRDFLHYLHIHALAPRILRFVFGIVKPLVYTVLCVVMKVL